MDSASVYLAAKGSRTSSAVTLGLVFDNSVVARVASCKFEQDGMTRRRSELASSETRFRQTFTACLIVLQGS